jgi:hypothetical protein
VVVEMEVEVEEATEVVEVVDSTTVLGMNAA